MCPPFLYEVNMDKWKDIIINLAKKGFLEFVVKKVLGVALSVGGFKVWLVKYLATELFEEVAEPVARLLIRKGQLAYDKIDGNIKINKIVESVDEENSDDYWDTIGSI